MKKVLILGLIFTLTLQSIETTLKQSKKIKGNCIELEFDKEKKTSEYEALYRNICYDQPIHFLLPQTFQICTTLENNFRLAVLHSVENLLKEAHPTFKVPVNIETVEDETIKKTLDSTISLIQNNREEIEKIRKEEYRSFNNQPFFMKTFYKYMYWIPHKYFTPDNNLDIEMIKKITKDS